MCDCDAPLVHEKTCCICTECGLQTNLLENRDYHSSYEDVHTCVYSRKKRFENLVDSVLYPSFHAKDTWVYAILKDSKFKTVPELVQCMRSLPLKDKRFCSVHLFATLTVDNHTSHIPPAPEFRTRLIRLFEEVLARHKTHGTKQFFSYPWLLRKLLTIIGCPQYSQYIKRIRCKRRRRKYEEMLRDLFTTGLTHGYTLPRVLGVGGTCRRTGFEGGESRVDRLCQ